MPVTKTRRRAHTEDLRTVLHPPLRSTAFGSIDPIERSAFGRKSDRAPRMGIDGRTPRRCRRVGLLALWLSSVNGSLAGDPTSPVGFAVGSLLGLGVVVADHDGRTDLPPSIWLPALAAFLLAVIPIYALLILVPAVGTALSAVLLGFSLAALSSPVVAIVRTVHRSTENEGVADEEA